MARSSELYCPPPRTLTHGSTYFALLFIRYYLTSELEGE